MGSDSPRRRLERDTPAAALSSQRFGPFEEDPSDPEASGSLADDQVGDPRLRRGEVEANPVLHIQESEDPATLLGHQSHRIWTTQVRQEDLPSAFLLARLPDVGAPELGEKTGHGRPILRRCLTDQDQRNSASQWFATEFNA